MSAQAIAVLSRELLLLEAQRQELSPRWESPSLEVAYAEGQANAALLELWEAEICALYSERLIREAEQYLAAQQLFPNYI